MLEQGRPPSPTLTRLITQLAAGDVHRIGLPDEFSGLREEPPEEPFLRAIKMLVDLHKNNPVAFKIALETLEELTKE